MTELTSTITLTLKLALSSTALLLLVSIPLAWWLASGRSVFRDVIATLVTLPLILPATVIGFYLLLVLGPNGPGGWIAPLLGQRSLAFSFTGLVIGSVIYSLPFVVQPIRNAFLAIDPGALDAAATLRASPLDRFFTVALPLARAGILTGALLGFAHTIGEFGVVLMIGGNIPGETRVLSVAIYDLVESLQYTQAHWLAGGMVLVAFVLTWLIYRLDSMSRWR